MKYSIVCVLALTLMISAAACGAADKKATVNYVSMYTSGSLEFVEVILDNEPKKFVVRSGDVEFAAVPDFLKSGDRITISYRHDKSIGHDVITGFSSPEGN